MFPFPPSAANNWSVVLTAAHTWLIMFAETIPMTWNHFRQIMENVQMFLHSNSGFRSQTEVKALANESNE